MTAWMEFPDLAFGMTSALTVFNNTAATIELFVAQLLFAVRLRSVTAPSRGGEPQRDGAEPLYAVGRSVAAAIVLLAFVLTLTQVSATTLPWMMPRSMINFSLLFLASTLAVRWLCRCDLRMATGIAICGYALQHIAAAIVEIADLGRIALCTAIAAPAFGSWTVGEIMRIMLFTAVYAACWRWYIRHFDVTKARMSSPATLAALTASVLLVTVGLSSYAYATTLSDATQFVLRAVSVLTCVIILLLFHEMSRNQTLSDELAFMRRMNDLRGNHYELLKDTIDATNVRYHDLKHQVTRLRAAVNRRGATDTDEPNAVLDEIMQSAQTYDAVARTGNDALDVVLTEKSLECARKGIRLTYMADADSLGWISDYDIYSLFGNALDNAIEAVEPLDADMPADADGGANDGGRGERESRRVIKLTVVARARLVHIRVMNYFERIEHDGHGGLATTKPDHTAHGFGLKSIRMIVGQLGGDVTVTADDGVFDLNILLPRPA